MSDGFGTLRKNEDYNFHQSCTDFKGDSYTIIGLFGIHQMVIKSTEMSQKSLKTDVDEINTQRGQKGA